VHEETDVRVSVDRLTGVYGTRPAVSSPWSSAAPQRPTWPPRPRGARVVVEVLLPISRGVLTSPSWLRRRPTPRSHAVCARGSPALPRAADPPSSGSRGAPLLRTQRDRRAGGVM
jgi:hypothetical protein